MNSIKSKVFVLFVLAIFFMAVMFHHKKAPIPVMPTVSNVLTLKKQAEDSAKLYRNKVVSLIQTNSELEQQLSANEVALKHVKQTNQLLEKRVQILTENVTTDTDTCLKLSDCDSLATTIKELSYSNDNKDSLYEQMETDLKAQLSNRDSVIADQSQAGQALQHSFDLSLKQQDTLVNNCKQLEHQFHRQTVKKKWLSTALYALCGITLYSLLKH